MMQHRELPTPDAIAKCFSYDPGDGLFRYARDFRHRKRGDLAGVTHVSGYVQIFVSGKRFYAHRLAWSIVNGPIPDGMEIDHIDGVKSNNAICNLRLASRSEQQRNKPVRSDNRAGLKGAIYNCRPGRRKHWHSCITVNGKTEHLGWFYTAEEASAAYTAEARRLHGQFVRLS